MAGSHESEYANAPRRVRALRFVAAKAASFPLRTESPNPVSVGWQKAEQLNQDHYGIIIAHMHANKGDTARMVKRTFESPLLGKKDILLPNAMHQYEDWYKPVGNPIHVRVLPVFTPETHRLAIENPAVAQKLEAKHGIDIEDPRLSRTIAEQTRRYTDAALPLLQRGGIEIVAPQGHREHALVTMTTAVESIVKRALRQDTHNIAVLFVGYDIKDLDGYGGVDSLNLFKTYRFRDGRCLTIDELLAEAGGEVGKLSGVIRREMEAAVPPAYLPKS